MLLPPPPQVMPGSVVGVCVWHRPGRRYCPIHRTQLYRRGSVIPAHLTVHMMTSQAEYKAPLFFPLSFLPPLITQRDVPSWKFSKSPPHRAGCMHFQHLALPTTSLASAHYGCYCSYGPLLLYIVLEGFVVFLFLSMRG